MLDEDVQRRGDASCPGCDLAQAAHPRPVQAEFAQAGMDQLAASAAPIDRLSRRARHALAPAGGRRARPRANPVGIAPGLAPARRAVHRAPGGMGRLDIVSRLEAAGNQVAPKVGCLDAKPPWRLRRCEGRV